MGQGLAVGINPFRVVHGAGGSGATLGDGGGHCGLQMLDRRHAAAGFRARHLAVGLGDQARHGSLMGIGVGHGLRERFGLGRNGNRARRFGPGGAHRTDRANRAH
ncbi:hypothetical protein ACFSHQ_19285 [Gemmobacter lanyuensis]